MYYDSITVNGTPYTGFAPQPSAPSSDPDNTGIQFQLDVNALGGTATAYLDQTSFTQTNPRSDIYKPLWDGEAAYAESGFPAPYTDPDMASSLAVRMYLTMWTNNIQAWAWYTFDNIKAQGAQVTQSFQQAYNYLGGAALTTGCTNPSGGLWSCGITKSGVTYLVLWDNTQTCAATVCTVGNQTVAGQWITYQDMTALSLPISIGATHIVPVGIKPVILTSGNVASNPATPAPALNMMVRRSDNPFIYLGGSE
jgi:hypothetical protein